MTVPDYVALATDLLAAGNISATRVTIEINSFAKVNGHSDEMRSAICESVYRRARALGY